MSVYGLHSTGVRETDEIEFEAVTGRYIVKGAVVRVNDSVKTYYDAYWSSRGFRPTQQKTDLFARLFEATIPVGAHCLDVGCGDGSMAGIWLASHGRNYVGVDISAHGVDAARASGLDARGIEDAASLPFSDSTFEAVVCIEVLEHLFLPHHAAAEMRRVLRPGGLLVATTPNVAYWRRRHELLRGQFNPFGDDRSLSEPWRDPHIRFFTPATLQSMLRSVGYTEIRVGGHGGTLTRIVGNREWDPVTRPGGMKQHERLMAEILGGRLHALARA